ncbi:hypothetical protein FRC12_001492, partial [Ceratobasidium sp. 428]
MQCLEQHDKQDKNLYELVKRLASMAPSIEAVSDLADESLKETVMDMLDLIEDVSVFILSRRRSDTLQRWRSAIDPDQEEQVQKYIVKFEELRGLLDTRIGVQGLRVTAADRRSAEAEREIPRSEVNARLRELQPADLATFDPDRRCVQDTRAEIVARLVDWAQTSKPGPGFAWMHGPAGFGKSSIATSVCVRLYERRVLGSSFFCRRDAPDLRDARRVLMTVVYELACRWEAYGRAVAAAIREDPGICTRHLKLIFEALVDKPFRHLAESQRPAQTLVVVVDALDECECTSARKQLLSLLLAMSMFGSWLRILVTARPNADIAEFFGEVDQGLFLEYDVVQYDASSDIQAFVQDQLKGVKNVKRWPNDAADLVSLRASGLFIWARTACRFILDGFDRLDRLTQVLSGTRLANIDALYTITIKASILDAADDNIACMLACLGPVVVTATRAPLSVDNLAELIAGHVSQDAFRRVIASLSSVLYADEKQSGAIRISHPSFMDYITSPGRSKELYVDLRHHNTILAKCCIDTMTRDLKFNICELETSNRFNSEVPNLCERVQEAISPYLEYSCLYWSSHVSYASMPALLESSLREFVFGRELLYWMEALSLLEKLNTAPTTLLEAMECFGQWDMADCCLAANDAYRFVLSFYDAISASTPHLYVSALAFAPSNSGIAQRMRRFFPKLLHVTEGGKNDWTPCLCTVSDTSWCLSVTFSPNGCHIVSGYDGGTMQVWDAETGHAALKPLTGHSGSVTSAAFSPDGRWLVSGSGDETIRVWDAETGEARLGPIRGHSHWVKSVMFSPDGHQIISGSLDKTVRVWSAETGEAVLHPLEGHSDAVYSVAFSPDGRRIVSGSRDTTLRVWDVETGELALQPLSGHASYVLSVAFSSDGRWIVSGWRDRTVRMWDAETGDMLLRPLTGYSGDVTSVAFSPDCSRIVFGSRDGAIRVLDSHTGSLVQALEGHSDCVVSVAFSPDNRRIASGSHDMTSRTWDVVDIHKVQAAETAHTLSGHTMPVKCVAYSPNGHYVVSGSDDTMVRIWHAETGSAALGPLEGHTAAVNCLAVSLDSRRIVSGSSDNTVRVWDAETGEAVFEPLQGHTDRVLCVAFSHDCRLIASGSEDRTLFVWDTETGQRVLGPLTGHSDDVYAAVFSTDSQRVFSYYCDETVHIWDVTTRTASITRLESYPHIYPSSAAFSPDGRRIVSVSDSTVHIWDTETGRLIIYSWPGHAFVVESVAFSPDGRWIASTSLSRREVRIWSAETGKPILELLGGHTHSVLSVAFSPDNCRLVSASWDATVRIWDLQSHTMLSIDTRKYLG